MKKKIEVELNHTENKQQTTNNDVSRELILTEPYLNYLSRVPNALRFLFYIDYDLFDKENETWVQYDKREPGCVGDLFSAHAKILQDYNSTSSPKILNLQYIMELHTILSQSVLGTDSQSGRIRGEFNCFPLSSDTATKVGLIELLKRIKEDNNSEGFILYERKKLNIASQVFRYLSSYCSNIYYDGKSPPNHINAMGLALEQGIKTVIQELNTANLITPPPEFPSI